MDKILIIIVLFGLGVFFIGKMFNPPVGPKYKLKSIHFNPENSQISQELGKQIFISKGKRKIINYCFAANSSLKSAFAS